MGAPPPEGVSAAEDNEPLKRRRRGSRGGPSWEHIGRGEGAPTREPKTIRVKKGGSVSLEGTEAARGRHGRPDRGAQRRLTAGETVALGLQLLRSAGGPEPFR